jgi:hypothetical protein
MLAPPGIARIVSLVHVDRCTIGGAVTCEECACVGGAADEVGAALLTGAASVVDGAEGVAALLGAAGVDAAGALTTGSSAW